MKTTRYLSFVTLAMTATLFGCAATGPSFERMASVPADKAVVYVYRNTAMHGAAYTPTVVINETTTIALSRGGYYRYVAAPGEITIAITNAGKRSITVQAVAGQTYYVRGGTIPMALGIPSIGSVDAKTAEEELKECKLITAATADASPHK